MIKIYIVSKNLGFSGEWYFHNKQNALDFSEKISGEVCECTATTKEYFTMRFMDFPKELIENPAIQFNII